jgi:hypothetical protein
MSSASAAAASTDARTITGRRGSTPLAAPRRAAECLNPHAAAALIVYCRRLSALKSDASRWQTRVVRGSINGFVRTILASIRTDRQGKQQSATWPAGTRRPRTSCCQERCPGTVPGRLPPRDSAAARRAAPAQVALRHSSWLQSLSRVREFRRATESRSRPSQGPSRSWAEWPAGSNGR